jgi:hypothetical protein
MSIAPLAPHRPRPTAPVAQITPAAPTVAVRSMLRTVERVLLRDGGHRGALVNARAAVLEGEERAALRADARASLQRLAAPVD